MEDKLLDLKTSDLLRRFGAGSHKPGSGSATALQGLLAAHLLRTVIDLTKNRNSSGRYSAALPALLKGDSELEAEIIPSLERVFQLDSEQFDLVIRLRNERDNAVDTATKERKTDEVRIATIAATEFPLQIARSCAKIATLGLEVFDRGFKSARGDSGVAISGALSAIAGCLSIVDLNLLSFGQDHWTDRVRRIRKALRRHLDELHREFRDRQSAQEEKAEERMFEREIKGLGNSLKGRRFLSDADLEKLAIDLQRLLWRNRARVWEGSGSLSAFEALDPEMALKCFEFRIERHATLGSFAYRGRLYEVAGQIDQTTKVVSISEQFAPEIRNFTTAHELGHCLLHTQPVLHRDRPLDGRMSEKSLSPEERQANKFASYFLMPEKLVRKSFSRVFLAERFRLTEESAIALGEGSVSALVAKCRSARGLAHLLAAAGFYHLTAFRSLAEQFNVSVGAMAIRLDELQLIDFSEP